MNDPETPRERLVRLATDRFMAVGVSDTSLRELAAELGTSHRMLLYHFGSRTGLLVAVSLETERRMRVALAAMFEQPGADLSDVSRRFWSVLSSEALAPLERLFFELYALGLRGREFATDFLDGIVEDWIEPQAQQLIAAGWTPEQARIDARLGVAVTRGLLLDLLATGDRDAVTRAFERQLQLFETALESMRKTVRNPRASSPTGSPRSAR